MNKINADVLKIISKLDLKQHPEGGYYKEIYRSNDIIVPPERFEGEKRNACTSIYYMLCDDDYSAWHRIKSDEIWHFYSGSALVIYVIDENGSLSSHTLGNLTCDENAVFQVTIKANQWFAAKVIKENSYSLVGCTVSPGFDFKDFQLGDREALIKQFPSHISIIKQLTRLNIAQSNAKNSQSIDKISLSNAL